MQIKTARAPFANWITASIIGVAMVSSARILKQHSIAAPALVPAPSVHPIKALTSWPLSQESVQRQVREQIVALTKSQILEQNGADYKLSDATVSQVSYSAKDDTFEAVVEFAWQSVTPSTVPQTTYLEHITLCSQGHKQYIGSVGMSTAYTSPTQNARICIKGV